MADIRILSWNLFLVPYLAEDRTKRVGRVIQHIHSLGQVPDFLCFQEVFFPKHANMIKRDFASAYQACDLAKRKAYPPWFLPGPNIGGIFYDIRRSGLLTLVSDAWMVESARLQYYNAEASEFKFWEGDGYADKGFLWSILSHRQLGIRMCVVNTHLQAYKDYDRIREKQLDQLWKRLSPVAQVMPVFISGDFNAKKGGSLLQIATRKYGWRLLSEDSAYHCEESALTPLRGERGVDHIFVVGDGMTPLRATSVSICNLKSAKPYSDHDGVVVDIALSDIEETTQHVSRLWRQAVTRRLLPLHLARLWREMKRI